MRLLFLVALVLTSVCPARAQVLQITVDGTWSQSSGTFSNIAVGTPFTLTQIFNVSTATVVSSDTEGVTYGLTGTSSITFAGITYSGTSPQIIVTADFVSTAPGALPLYGYQFNQYLATGGAFAAQLLSTDSSVAPDFSLDNLHSYSSTALNGAAVSLGGENFVFGSVSSVTVQTESVPEPSAIALAFIALGAFGWLRWRLVRHIS